MSIYLALHTTAAPSIGEIAEFGAEALRLGAKPDQPLAIQRDGNGALTVVLNQRRMILADEDDA